MRPRICGQTCLTLLVTLSSSFATACRETDDGTVPCDIRDSGCQDRIFQLTAEVRGDSGVVVPEVRTITEADARADLTSLVDEEHTETTDAYGAALELLGLLTPGIVLDDALVDLLAGSTAAYYDHRTQRVSVIDRGEARDDLDGTFVLAHELVHALQDQAGQLTEFRNAHVDSTDSEVATTSLIEGEATVLGAAVLERVVPPTQRLDWDRFVDNIDDAVFTDIPASDEPFLSALSQLPYALGTAALAPAWLAVGRAAFDQEYADPRLSVLEWASGSRPEELDCLPTEAPPGYEALDHDRFGMIALFAEALGWGELTEVAWANADQWRDDRVVVFRAVNDSAAIAVAWRLRLSTPDAAQSLAAEMSALGLGLSAVASERDVRIHAATDPAVIAGWAAVENCGTVDDLPAREDTAMPMMR